MFIQINVINKNPIIVNFNRVADIEQCDEKIDIRYEDCFGLDLYIDKEHVPAFYAALGLAISGESTHLKGIGSVIVLPKIDESLSSLENLKTLMHLQHELEREHSSAEIVLEHE